MRRWGFRRGANELSGQREGVDRSSKERHGPVCLGIFCDRKDKTKDKTKEISKNERTRSTPAARSSTTGCLMSSRAGQRGRYGRVSGLRQSWATSDGEQGLETGGPDHTWADVNGDDDEEKVRRASQQTQPGSCRTAITGMSRAHTCRKRRAMCCTAAYRSSVRVAAGAQQAVIHCACTQSTPMCETHAQKSTIS